MPAARAKIFGERNTGTNALTRIVETNSETRFFPATASELDRYAARWTIRVYALARRRRERRLDKIFIGRGPLECWKHCVTDFDDIGMFDGVLVVFTVRHPASWVLSLFKHPHQVLTRVPDTLSDFLGWKWETLARDRAGGASFRPLELYQRKLRSNLELARRLTERGVVSRYVKFEDIVMNQEQVFRTLAPDLANPADDFEELRKSTKAKGKDLNYYRNYYGQELWREELEGLEGRINEQVDWEMFRPFGYSPLAPAAPRSSIMSVGADTNSG